jgi:large subunit ribosomal protein L9
VRQARGLKLDHRKIRLEQPIRELGTHMIEIEVAPGVMTAVKTMVVEAK